MNYLSMTRDSKKYGCTEAFDWSAFLELNYGGAIKAQTKMLGDLENCMCILKIASFSQSAYIHLALK